MERCEIYIFFTEKFRWRGLGALPHSSSEDSRIFFIQSRSFDILFQKCPSCSSFMLGEMQRKKFSLFLKGWFPNLHIGLFPRRKNRDVFCVDMLSGKPFSASWCLSRRHIARDAVYVKGLWAKNSFISAIRFFLRFLEPLLGL